jgi:hypothetical protein
MARLRLSKVALRLGVVAALALPGTTPAAPPDPLRLFKAGKLDQACPLFDAVAEKKRTDGAAWVDAGLCAFRQGKVDRGRAATVRALRYGNAKVRKAAAYNLSKFLTPDEFPDEDCADLAVPEELGCPRRAWACVHKFGNMGWGNNPGLWWLERWALVGTGAAGQEAARSWLDGVEPLIDPGEEPSSPVPEGMTRIVYYTSTWERPRDTPSGPEQRMECGLLLVDPCGGRAFLRCARFDSGQLDAKPTGFEIQEIALSAPPGR